MHVHYYERIICWLKGEKKISPGLQADELLKLLGGSISFKLWIIFSNDKVFLGATQNTSIIYTIIHSKYFPFSDWLKPQA